jgi:hypothetical protein
MVDIFQQASQLRGVRSRVVAIALAGALLMFAASAGQPENAPAGSYARAHYDILLVENCGLATAEVERGFELARTDRLRTEALGEAAARAARIDAGVAFDLEWQNRGLGGLRPWCREDGKQAALAFFARFIDERYPRPGATP